MRFCRYHCKSRTRHRCGVHRSTVHVVRFPCADQFTGSLISPTFRPKLPIVVGKDAGNEAEYDACQEVAHAPIVGESTGLLGLEQEQVFTIATASHV